MSRTCEGDIHGFNASTKGSRDSGMGTHNLRSMEGEDGEENVGNSVGRYQQSGSALGERKHVLAFSLFGMLIVGFSNRQKVDFFALSILNWIS